MSPSEVKDTKKTGVRPEPLCLFCYPEDNSFLSKKTYVNAIHGNQREENLRRLTGRDNDKEEFWLKKRTEARIRRRRMREPIRNLRSYLLTFVKNEQVLGPKGNIPSLFEVLETVKDAWPSPSSRNATFHRHKDRTQQQSPHPSIMKDEKHNLQNPCQLFNRRLSMPEELMRKHSMEEIMSEESEANKTTVEISPSSSSTIETTRRKDAKRTETTGKNKLQITQPTKMDAYQQTNDSEDGKTKKADPPNLPNPDLPKRVMQEDYYKQGKQIIKMKMVEKGTCTCRGEHQSSTTASAKDETDDSGTTESTLSSSPMQLPKRESSSGCLSSESDNIRCTCADLSSKETSTELYLSGKSTLSQTVSDKSTSTQDSTVSINSVSTRGSTVSDNSNSTTPEIERTSAKGTTTSTDYSPRTPRNRKNRRRDQKMYHDVSKTCPKHSGNYLIVGYGGQCPVHSKNFSEKSKTTADASTNTDYQEDSTTQTAEILHKESKFRSIQIKTDEKPTAQSQEERYKWAKLSQEELYMMQQLRHRKFIESQRKLSNPLLLTPDINSLTACGTGSAYAETERHDQSILIPRYSALPRSLSMLVNTSSPDTSHNTDSDSLEDSLEDQPITHVHKLYFDTKMETKPVRGDVNLVQNCKQKQRQPRGRAFFVSIKEPFGEDEKLESIQKIPQPPEKIKNQIFERHLKLCIKHKRLHKAEELKPGQKKKKPTEGEATPKKKNLPGETKKPERKIQPSKTQPEVTVKKKKDARGRFGSKIPVLVSSRSASSSPEGKAKPKAKPARPKARVKREKEQEMMEATQILEITHTGSELSLQKPQAVIHPSQTPFDHKPELTIPPLVSTLSIPSFRQTWNKQTLIANARRSPMGNFRQRFEVIPEEKSSSMSSAEEKKGRDTLPKFTDASTSPVPSDKIHFHSYNVNEVPNIIVAKITNKQLETLPYVKNNDNQKIILLSSKPQNSTKGRDALIAINREDFHRLAKGWMNFYKLNENMENEESEEKPEEKKKTEKLGKETQQIDSGQKQEEPKLGDTVRFDCSNTILRTAKSIPLMDSIRSVKKQNSLPELKHIGKTCEMHKSVTSRSLPRLKDDDTDSDSTDYMEPPSPRVLPLPIDGISSDATLSSSDNELPQPEFQSLKYLQFKKRTVISKPGPPKKENQFETSLFGKKKNSSWSVTVAGTVELSKSTPNLEMKLSFPANVRPPVVSHSDCGFAGDSNYSKLGGSLQDLDSCTAAQEVPLGSGNLKQKWMVIVKNPKKGSGQVAQKFSNTSSDQRLPDLELSQSRNPKKVLKSIQLDEKVKRIVERKMQAVWPKVRNVIEKEFLTESGRLITEPEEFDDGSLLSVRGCAVSLQRKQKPATMTERDVTRRYTSRTN